jgi:hypothetical protein
LTPKIHRGFVDVRHESIISKKSIRPCVKRASARVAHHLLRNFCDGASWRRSDFVPSCRIDRIALRPVPGVFFKPQKSPCKEAIPAFYQERQGWLSEIFPVCMANRQRHTLQPFKNKQHFRWMRLALQDCPSGLLSPRE